MKIFIILLMIPTFAFGQENSEKFKNEILKSEQISKRDIKNEVINSDISGILTKTKNSSVLGFIGEEHQRIRIKFISVIKNNARPDQYFVYGKNMVKNNVCEFLGTLTISNAYVYNNPEIKDIKQGIIIGNYLFYENPTQKHVGLFKGVFKTSWYMDKNGRIQYNDLMIDTDEFSNNQFVGVWSSYDGLINKPCNWGDYRIAMSGDLDSGAAEFFPDQKYIQNGWITYQKALGGSDDDSAQEARKSEETEWWK